MNVSTEKFLLNFLLALGSIRNFRNWTSYLITPCEGCDIFYKQALGFKLVFIHLIAVREFHKLEMIITVTILNIYNIYIHNYTSAQSHM